MKITEYDALQKESMCDLDDAVEEASRIGEPEEFAHTRCNGQGCPACGWTGDNDEPERIAHQRGRDRYNRRNGL